MIFKRPNTTVRVFEAIRAARPAKLFIAADAPRPNVPGEIEKCAAILNKSIGLSRFHIFLTRLLAPVAPQIIKVLWWFSRRFHDRSNANS